MTSLELLDSKRFCAFMDRFHIDWSDQALTDEGRAKLLDELWQFAPDFAHEYKPLTAITTASPVTGVEIISDFIEVPRETPKRGRPKGSKNAPKLPREMEESMRLADKIGTEALRSYVADIAGASKEKLKLKEEMTGKLDPAEVKRILAEQAREPKARDPQLIVNDAVAEVIKPNWAATPLVEGYRHFIVNADRKGERVSFEPEKWRNALTLHGLNSSNITFKPEGLGMDPGSLSTGRTGNQWRVMIG